MSSTGSKGARRAVWGRVVASLAVLALAACAVEGGAEPAPLEPPEPRTFARMAVVGASASAGFNLESEAGRRVTLSEVVQLAAPGTFERSLDLAGPMFFMNPDQNLDEAIAELRAFRPQVILAPDVLFWFGYGPKAEENRVLHLRQAIERLEGLLDELDATLFVGDFPDVRDASFLMMPARYEPTDATLAELNEVVRAWSAARDDVEPVPLADFVESLRGGRPVELFGRTVDTSERSRWLQRDGLHPTLEGTAALALMLLDALGRTAHLGDGIRTDSAELADAVRAGAAAEAAPAAGG